MHSDKRLIDPVPNPSKKSSKTILILLLITYNPNADTVASKGFENAMEAKRFKYSSVVQTDKVSTLALLFSVSHVSHPVHLGLG